MSTAAVAPRLDVNGHTERRSSHDALAPPAPPANAGPLGLSAFSITTFLLSMVNAGLIAKGAEPIVFGLGLYLISWGIFTAYMFVASFKTTRELNVVFGLLLFTFLALGIGEVAASSGLTKAGGYLGLLTAAAGAYTAMAEITNTTFARTVLPIHSLS